MDPLALPDGEGALPPPAPLRLLTGAEDFNATSGQTDTEILRATCRLYGGLFLLLFLAFLVLRAVYPAAYNLKRSYAHLAVPLARAPFGSLSWTWRVFSVPCDDLAEQCGMDAATTVRLLECGIKLSLVAVGNSLYLFPIYKWMGHEAAGDPAKECSLSNLAQGHGGTVATAVAAYVFFAAAMHFVDKVSRAQVWGFGEGRGCIESRGGSGAVDGLTAGRPVYCRSFIGPAGPLFVLIAIVFASPPVASP